MSKKTYFQELKSRIRTGKYFNSFEVSIVKSVADKSYVNWPARIKWLAANKKDRKYKDTEKYKAKHKEAVNLSGSWVTCACGNQCAIIPRDGDGRPTDMGLYALGHAFHNQIDLELYTEASKTLMQIEKHSAELVAKIKKQNLNKL